MSAEVPTPYTAQKEKRQQEVPEDRKDTGKHEVGHGYVAFKLGVAIKRIAARPQGGPVLGVTETAPTTLENHNAIAMASVAGGHSGTGGDRGNSRFITWLSRGRVRAEQGIAIAGNILSSAKGNVLKIAGEMVAQRGEISGGEFPNIIYKAEAELEGVAKEKELVQKHEQQKQKDRLKLWAVRRELEQMVIIAKFEDPSMAQEKKAAVIEAQNVIASVHIDKYDPQRENEYAIVEAEHILFEAKNKMHNGSMIIEKELIAA
jgi:hypothetical protein